MNKSRFSRLVAGGFAAMVTVTAGGDFDLIQIEQVIGGVNGDTSAQSIQLRMRQFFQCLVSQARLRVHDAAGQNPILLIDITADVFGCNVGDRVLITSAGFADFLNNPIAADFTLTNLIPESYLAAGSLTFEDDFGTIYWRLSWGGDNYIGPNDGSLINDADGDFGPPWPGALPSDGLQALQFQGAATALSTSNADDYTLTAGAAVFTNNNGDSATVTRPAECPWDCDGSNDRSNDGSVGIIDFLTLLAQWGQVGTSCDFDGGGVGINDFLELLANWGPCP